MESKKKQIGWYRFVQVTWPWLLYLGAVVLIAAIVGTLTGCTTTKKMVVEKPVVVEKVHHDTLVQTRLRVDTCIMKDSVVVTELGTDRWRTKYVMRVRTDTIFKSRVDTVPKVVPVKIETTREVPTRLKWWQVALQWLGGLALAGAILCIMLCLKR